MDKNGKLLEIGIALHTALRKCCDCNLSSALYNAIEVIPPDLWGDYILYVYDELEEVDDLTDAKKVEDAVRQATHKIEYYDPNKNLLRCLLEAFDEADKEWNFKSYTEILANTVKQDWWNEDDKADKGKGKSTNKSK